MLKVPTKACGHPLLLESTLDAQVREYVTRYSGSGQHCYSATDCSFLRQYGGSIVLTKAWAKSLLSRMGFVKCKGSTSVTLPVPEFEKHKEHHIIAYYLFLNLL